jgi:hypothetical protein
VFALGVKISKITSNHAKERVGAQFGLIGAIETKG